MTAHLSGRRASGPPGRASASHSVPGYPMPAFRQREAIRGYLSHGLSHRPMLLQSSILAARPGTTRTPAVWPPTRQQSVPASGPTGHCGHRRRHRPGPYRVIEQSSRRQVDAPAKRNEHTWIPALLQVAPSFLRQHFGSFVFEVDDRSLARRVLQQATSAGGRPRFRLQVDGRARDFLESFTAAIL